MLGGLLVNGIVIIYKSVKKKCSIALKKMGKNPY